MNVERAVFRLHDIERAIRDIRTLLAGKSVEHIRAERFERLAAERLFEILSEASRHVPTEWKSDSGAEVPWRQIGDLGNELRHAYHRVDLDILWSIYEHDLGPLEAAIDAMLAAHDPGGEFTPPPRP